MTSSDILSACQVEIPNFCLDSFVRTSSLSQKKKKKKKN